MERGNPTYPPHVAPKEEKQKGAKAPLVLPAGEERNGEDSRDQSSPGLGASAAEWGGVEGPGELGRKEKNGASPSAVDTSGVRGDWTQKGASGSSQKNERRPQNRVPECRWGTEDVHPVPVLVPRAQRRQRVGSRSRGQSVSLKVLGVQPVSHVRRMPISVSQPQSIPGPNVQPMPISVPRAQPMPIPVPRVQSVPVTVPPSQPMPISMPHVQPVAYSLSHVQPVHIPLHHVQSLPTHVSQALPMPVPVPHVQPGPITVPHAHPIPLPVPHVQPLPFPVPQVQSVPVRVPYIQPVPVTVPLTQPMPVPVPQAQSMPVTVPQAQSMPVTVPHMQPMQIDVPQTQPMPAPVSSAQHRAVNEPSIPRMPVPGELPTSVPMACVPPIPIAVPRIRPVLVSTVQPVPVLVPHRPLRDRFTEPQLQELEQVFQRNHCLRAEEGKQLARGMGVTEAKLQRWFKKRRVQFRREHSQSRMNDDAPPRTHSTSLKMAQEP